MHGKIPGASIRTIPMYRKIARVEVEHADDKNAGSDDKIVLVIQWERHQGTDLIFR